LIDKLKNLERTIADEYGPFWLFGLFLREGSPDKWDVVVAAPWFSKLNSDPIEFISERLKAAIGKSGLMMISRIIALSDKDEFLTAVNEAVQVQHGLYELEENDFAGVQIVQGFVISSSRQKTRGDTARR
jgi:hypothetical protein